MINKELLKASVKDAMPELGIQMGLPKFKLIIKIVSATDPVKYNIVFNNFPFDGQTPCTKIEYIGPGAYQVSLGFELDPNTMNYIIHTSPSITDNINYVSLFLERTNTRTFVVHCVDNGYNGMDDVLGLIIIEAY